jgi:hypothetical protein
MLSRRFTCVLQACHITRHPAPLTRTRAIQIELASVQDTVSNAMLGKMRMQFWRDAVNGIAEVRGWPAAEALQFDDG